MAYNVENFFDTKHDAGTEDYTYLPMAVKKTSKEVQKYCAGMSKGPFKDDCLKMDWSETIFAKKIESAAKVIKSYGNGKGADIVILEEIENLSTVTQLADKGLTGLYKYKNLTEGDDTRGISLGVLSKYPITSLKHHSTYLDGKKLNTRGILEVTINVDGKSVTVFGNHWPSQGNDVSHRLASAEQLVQLADASKSHLILAVGDFNTLDSDKPHPFALMGNDFYDAEQEAREQKVKLMPGTHNYKGEWNSLDRIFVHKNSKVLPSWSTFEIISHPWMMKGDVPNRFDARNGTGYSDHLPIVVQADL